mmetsp:Transcript_7653/g.16017  ORF Transcript_7653/g.16017 Transcript_7653/m.16017 type:complete len:241 (+) Transcript_7653:1798-2520(+)
MQKLTVVHHLADVHPCAIMVGVPHDVVDQPDPIHCAKDGARLWIQLAVVIGSRVHMALVDVRNNATIAVVELAPPRIVILVLGERREVLRLQLQIVLPHLRNPAKVRLVRGHSHEDLVTISRIVQHEDQAAVAELVHYRPPPSLPELHAVPLFVSWWLEATSLLLRLRGAPTNGAVDLVWEDHHNVGAGHAPLISHARLVVAILHSVDLGLLFVLLQDILCSMRAHKRHGTIAVEPRAGN